jgi:hypothetical protein
LGTDKLTQGHGLEPHELGLSDQKTRHRDPLSILYVCIFRSELPLFEQKQVNLSVPVHLLILAISGS